MTAPAGDPSLVPSQEALEREYADLREDLRHVGTRIDAARTFGVGAVGAILTLAIQQQLAVVALGGAGLAHCFALIDLTNSFRYSNLAGRARRVELALDAYIEYERSADDQARIMLEDSLDDLGKRPFQLDLNEPGRHQMAFAHPKAVFKVLYPTLLLAAGLLSIFLQVRSGTRLEAGGVTFLAVSIWGYCLPKYLDPTRPPLCWTRPSDTRWVRRIAALAAPLLIAIAAGAAIARGSPAEDEPKPCPSEPQCHPPQHGDCDASQDEAVDKAEAEAVLGG